MKNQIQAFLQEQIRQGIGVRKIAKQTGVSPSTVSRVLNGKASPDIDTAEKLLKPFGFKIVIIRQVLWSDCETEQGYRMSKGDAK